MASLSKTYSEEKRFGQIYTPTPIVEKILAACGYDSPTILGKKILDPACGDGRFLSVVVARIIAYSPKADLAKNLSFVYGWDIDEAAITSCKSNLDALIAPYQITVAWNIEVCDALHQMEENTFDFIVGNPPYIRIQHLEAAQRKYIQTNYHFCKSGSTDIYIAFYELAYRLLRTDGICGFITPNTFFYTVTAKPLRQFFLQQKNIKKITNYADIQVFDNATTYSAIVIFDKKTGTCFDYEKAISLTNFEHIAVDFETLNEKNWQLSTQKATKIDGVRLGDIAKIHVGITTLCDKAYILTFVKNNDAQSLITLYSRISGEITLEKGILKPIIKASTLKNAAEPIKEYVIFPYQNGQIINEASLQADFPLTYQYLLDVKEHLDKRDAGKPNPVAWYAFGRSQGLQTSFGKKILFSPMNLRPNFILSENETATFYSGYCIKFEGNYEDLLPQLNSERMQTFVSISSRDFRGGWKAYNKKILEDFIISL